MSSEREAQLERKLKRVRELVELLENYGEKGFSLPLNFSKQKWNE